MDESDPSAPLKLDFCFRLHVLSLGKLLPNLLLLLQTFSNQTVDFGNM